jgi:glycosyltransferase involved in cell wall biosynthesis
MTETGGTAIYFHPDAIEGEGRELVGRRSAGSSFLRGYLAHAGGDAVRIVTDVANADQTFERTVRAMGETRPIETMSLKSGDPLGRAGTIFFPTPGFQNAPWVRLRQGPNTVSLVGITHTVSTRRIIEGLHNLIAQPVEPWDALICTSRAVKSVVETQLDAESRFFKERFGASRVLLPQLPVIPLAISAEDFKPRAGARQQLRARFDVSDDTIVVMTMGRLSVVEKANPLPLLLALEQVAERTGKDIRLWMTGWTKRQDEEALHHEAIERLCRRVKARIFDGREPELRRDIWAAADIFTLPVDSIQETFGLAPVEAMAAGLPVVMPDWDGFRDTVLDGETGFLVPTRAMPAGSGDVLAQRFANGQDGYLQHLALVQAQVQIDIPAYADALVKLVENAELRARMGARGQERVRTSLDWSAVIPQYLELADALAERRRAAMPIRQTNPMAIDPFTLYRQYPSGQIRAEDRIRLNGSPGKGEIELHDKLSARQLYHRHPVPLDQLKAVCNMLASKGEVSVAELAELMKMKVSRAMVIVMMLAKSDMVRFASESGRDQ